MNDKLSLDQIVGEPNLHVDEIVSPTDLLVINTQVGGLDLAVKSAKGEYRKFQKDGITFEIVLDPELAVHLRQEVFRGVVVSGEYPAMMKMKIEKAPGNNHYRGVVNWLEILYYVDARPLFNGRHVNKALCVLHLTEQGTTTGHSGSHKPWEARLLHSRIIPNLIIEYKKENFSPVFDQWGAKAMAPDRASAFYFHEWITKQLKSARNEEQSPIGPSKVKAADRPDASFSTGRRASLKKGPNMRRIAIGLLLISTMTATEARAQFGRGGFIGAGSTPQGDYLRGIGIEAWGMGLYNLNTAQANSINLDTSIRLDSYMSAVSAADRAYYNALLDKHIERQKRNYEANRDRIRDHPERYDVFTGNALNMAFEQMNDPAVQEASLRGSPVQIPREMIRRIPFKLDQKGLIFSIQRLTARGKGKWPVAFQQDHYAPYLKAYLNAVDTAMDQMIDGKIENQTIEIYKKTVIDLTNKLEREYEDRTGDLRYREAKKRLREMEKATDLMKAQTAQSILAEMDRYNGKTVNDLRKFMLDHHLKFAEVNDESADERSLYVELFAAIDQMRGMVVGTPAPRAQER